MTGPPEFDSFTATYAQQRLFFIDRLDPGNPAYNVVAVCHRLRGPLDVPGLSASLQALVSRHETLRTTFTLDGSAVRQVVHHDGRFPLELVDLSGEPRARSERLDAIVADAVGSRMDAATGPLARAVLVRLDGHDHVLVIVLHHLIADGWSIGVLRRELSENYPVPPAREPPTIQYGDYAEWQRSVFDGPDGQAALSWWRDRFADPPPRLDLPLADARPTRQSFRGDRHEHHLPDALTRRVNAFALAAGTTPYTVLLAAFVALLHRYSGREDFVIGTPVAARPEPELEQLIGYFANTVPLRHRPRASTTFAELLDQVRGTVLDAFSALGTPFERIVEAIAPHRDPSANPLFQVLFALHNFTVPALRLAGLDVTAHDFAKKTTRFDLSLDITDDAGVLRCVWEYASDLLDRDRVARLSRHWVRLLDAVVAEPRLALGEVDLLDAPEHRELARIEDGPSAGWDRRPLVDQFDDVVDRGPDRIAITCDGEATTYGQLRAAARGVAAALVGTEGPVAICVPRGVPAIAAMLGALYAGVPYLPLDAGHPTDRLARIIADAGATTIITDRAFTGPRVLAPDRLGPTATAVRAGHDQPLAYVIYTSGSTGRPKGVAVAQSSVSNLIAGLRTTLGWSAEDVWTTVHSFAFDLSVWEIWPPLLSGGRLVIAREEEQRSVAALWRLVQDSGTTMLSLTPSVLRELVRLVSGEDLARLRVVMSGGEALAGDIADRLRRWPVELWNLYGPTEATVWTAACRVTGDAARARVVPLGDPLPNTCLRVLDERLRPVPVGVPGELFIGGAGVAVGYHGHPEWTRERFVPDPDRPGRRLYRTGDRVVRRSPSALHFLGRLDGQLKIRGHRVETGEVEAALRQQPGVQDAVVVAVQRGDHSHLVGYVVGDGRQLRPPALVARLRAGLPGYLTPSVVLIDAIPRTANGKLDTGALPPPPRPSEVYEAPRDDEERRLAEVWQRLLGVPVGVHDSFFDLGGHSLLAMQLAGELHALTGREITPQLVFDAPTVATMAAALRDESQNESRAEVFALLTADATPDASIFGGGG